MTEANSPPRSEPPLSTMRTGGPRVFFLSWLLLSLIAIGWTFATPISASPDEPAHIIKAASVVRGQFVGEPSEAGHVVQVPRYIAATHAATCFAFQPHVTPACADTVPGDPADIVSATTTAGLYNPMYYLIVGAPSLFFPDDAGIYAMRIISGILSSLFLALTVMIVWTFRNRTLPVLAVAIATPPMLFFLSGSVNPNALEATATLASFAAMTAIVRHPNDSMLVARCIILAVSAAVAVNSRGLSPLWLLVAILAPLLLLAPGQLGRLVATPAVKWTIGVVAIASALAVAWTLGANSLTAAIDDPSPEPYPGVGSSPISGFLHVVRNTVEFAHGLIGIFGWLDTPAPALTYFVWAALTGTLLFVAFVVLRGRDLRFSTMLAAAFVVLPAVVQGAYITGGGIIWQGRYTLPLFAMLVVGVAAVLGGHFEGLSPSRMRRVVLIVVGAWAATQIVTFATVLRRYVVGTDGSWGEMFRAPEWSAPGGNIFVLAMFTAVVLGTAIAGWRCATPRRDAIVAMESAAPTR